MDLGPGDNPTIDYDALLSRASSITGTPVKKTQRPDTRVQSILERMRGGESGQESSGNTKAVNPDSGALGQFQVMPSNVPQWTRIHYGQTLTPDQFKNNPQAQQAVFNGQMGGYIRKALPLAGGDEDKAIRMAAAAWYGPGERAFKLYDDPKPQFYNGKEYPSFREYTTKVLGKSKAGQSFDYADLLKRADAITGGPQEQPKIDYQALIDRANQITGPPSSKPSPTFAAPMLPTPTDQPVVNTPSLAGNTPPVESLMPTEAQPVALSQPTPYAPSSDNLITQPATNQVAAPTYSDQQFTDWANRKGVPKTAMSRAAFEADLKASAAQPQVQTLGGLSPVQNQPTPPTVANQRGSQGLPAAVNAAPQQKSTGLSTSVGQPTQPQYTEKDFTAWSKALGVPKTPMMRKQFEEDLASGSDFGKVEVGANPSDFAVNGRSVTSDAFAPASQTEDGGYFAPAKVSGNRLPDLTHIAGYYQPPKGMSEEDAFRNALTNAGASVEGANDVIQKIRASGKPLFENGYTGGQIDVSYQNLKDAGVGGLERKSPEQLSEELKQRVIASPTEDEYRQRALDELSGGIDKADRQIRGALETQGQYKPPTEDEIQYKINELKANEPTQEQKENAYNIAQRIGAGEAGLYAGTGGLVHQVAGVMRVFGLNAPLTRFGSEMELTRGYRNQGQGPQGVGENVADFVGASVPQLAELTLLPGGPIAKFGAIGGLQKAGEGGSAKEVIGSTLTGAATGTVFHGAEQFENPLAKLGTVFGGSAVVNAASSQSIDENLKNDIVNTLFEAGGIVGPKLKGQFVQFWKGGEPLTVGITPKGDVILPRANVETDNKVVLDPENPVYKMAPQGIRANDTGFKPLRHDVDVPTTEAEPEKTQFTSSVDEIRQKNARTTKEVQALFPKAELSREQAAELRRQAWGDEDVSKQNAIQQPSAQQIPSENVPTAKAQASSEPVTETTQNGTSTAQPNAAAPETRTVTHPNPAIDGKPIVAETGDGKVVVPNPENKSGVSVVTNRATEKPEPNLSFNNGRAYLDGADIGTLDYAKKGDKLEVNKIYLSPEKQKQGLGRQVLQKLFSDNPDVQTIEAYPLASSEPWWYRLADNVRGDGTVEVTRESLSKGMENHFSQQEKGFEITGQTGPQATSAIGRLAEQRDTARRQADTNAVSGLPNNHAFEKARPRLEADPNTEITTVDLNNFKAINDSNSHLVGDSALKDAGGDLLAAAKNISPQAQVFHPHGDEYIIASPKGTGADIVKNADDVFSQRKYGDVSGSLAGSSGNTYAEAEKGLPDAKAARKALQSANAQENTVGAGTGNNQREPASSGQESPVGTEAGSGRTEPQSQPAGSRPTERQPSASVKSEPIKPTEKVFTERGTSAEIETRAIPRDKILTSLDEGYPAELQPRDRSRVASKDQINEISGNLNPELLGDSPKASDGRPLVVPVEHNGETKYAVVSGNGRTEAIRSASGDAAKSYDEFVQSKGGKAGDIYAGVLDPSKINDLPEFAREANESSTAKMSATEQARADAKDLDLSNFTPSDDGSIHTGANREFIRNFVGKLPASERGGMMLPDGTLSQEGINRVRNAVFANAYGDSETGLAVIQRMAESTDNNVKRITNALLQNAPGFADLKAGIDSGSRHPHLDITGDITKAVEKFSFLRENGDSVDEYLKQRNMFGEDLDPFQKRILQALDKTKNSAKALSGILNNYIRIANEIGDPKQMSMFADTKPKDSSTLFKEAVLEYEGGHELEPATKQVDLFNADQGRAVQREAGAPRAESVPETAQTGPPQETRTRAETPTSEAEPELKPGDTVQKGGILGKVYERGGQLRVKFERDGQAKSQPLSDEWKKASNPEAGSASVDLLTLGLGKTAKEDVIPGVKEAAKVLADSVDDVRGAVFASGRGEPAKLTSGELRKNLAEMARSYDIAQHALKGARNYFSKNPIEDNYDFISRMESGDIDSLPPAEQPFAKNLRRLLDESRDRVRLLGTGKLENFIENYFPHVWKDPNKATDVFKNLIMGRRPFEGSKSFLKKRTIATFEDGIKAGLEPMSDNPVDMALLKIREMDRYVAAHKTLQYLKENGLAEFTPIGELPKPGFAKIDDRIGDVYLPPTMVKPEYVDTQLYEGMQKLAKDLGIKHERLSSAGPGRIGYSEQGRNRVVTQYATGERVLAHEIGHQLDHKYGLADRFLKNPDKAIRGKLKQELRDLADSKQATLDNPEGRKTSYTRKRAEQMAHILEGYVNDRAAFEKKYPTVSKVFNQVIDENPELKPIRELQRSLGKTELQTEFSRGGITKIGQYYAAEPAAKIINNHLSPGLQGNSAFRAWRYAGNLMNQFQLGFSAFHAMFTTIDAVTSKAALAIEQLGAGRTVEAAKSAAEVPVSWLTNLIRGDKVYKEWLTPGSTDPVHQEITRLMVEAGGRAKMDDFYHTRAATRMLDAFKRGNVFGGVMRLPAGTVDLVARPVLEYLVPRQKLGVFADLAKSEVARLGEDATYEQVREAVQRAWDSVDNRMGQLVYDNLFWNKLIKDGAMASIRSVGWNLGSFREGIGGVKDAFTLPLRARRAFKEGKAVEPIVTHRMAYVAALPLVSAALGAMTQYLFTGKGPEELKDCFFPKTGNFDENGRPERLSLPTYLKDVYAYTRHPGKTLQNKVHPLISTVAQMLENKDYYSTEIRHADDPIMQQLLDEAKFVGKNMIPFAGQGLSKEIERKGSTATKILPFLGFTPAPKDVNTSKAEDLLSEIQAQHREVGSRTKQEAERSQLLSDLVRAKKRGEDIRPDLRKAIGAGVLKRSDAQLILKRASSDYLSYGVKPLALDDALKVYDAADDNEKKRLQPILIKKAVNAATKNGLTNEQKLKIRELKLFRGRLVNAQ